MISFQNFTQTNLQRRAYEKYNNWMKTTISLSTYKTSITLWIVETQKPQRLKLFF